MPKAPYRLAANTHASQDEPMSSMPPPWDPESPAHSGLVEAVRAYRRAGWLGRFGGASDEDAARALREEWWSQWEEEYAADEPDDGILAALDPERAIWFDPEADTCEDNRTYVDVLASLCEITGGELEITGVVEDWRREPGRVHVALVVNGTPGELHLHEFHDWVDPKVIEGLNRFLPRDGRHFYCFDGGGQAFCITWASPAEVAALEAARPARLLDKAPAAWPGVHSDDG